METLFAYQARSDINKMYSFSLSRYGISGPKETMIESL